jgi:outer membrane protein, heavy metal efflux system
MDVNLSKKMIPSAWCGFCSAMAGCVQVNSTGQIQEAMSLTQEHTGVTANWTAQWEEVAPAWEAGAILTMDQAVEIALRNQRELRAEIETIGKAQADLVQAGLLQNPVLTVGAMLPSGGGRAKLDGGLIPFQGLRDLWLIPVRKEAANAALQETILRVADLAVSTAAQAKMLYARIQHAQRAIELTRENLGIVDQTVNLIQSRHAAGRTTQIEVNTERIRSLRLQSDLLALEAEQHRLKRELLMIMGFADSSDSWAVSPIHELEGSLIEVSSDEALLAQAFEQRLDLCAARWTVWAAGQELAIARGEAWPAFDFSIAFERDPAPRSQNMSVAAQAGNALVGGLTGAGPEPPSVEPFGPKPRDGKWMVGPMMDLEIPIFDQNQAQITKAVHELRRRYALHSALEQRAVQKVREFKLMHDQAIEQVKLYREAIIPEVEANLGLIQQSYRAGADVFTDYLRSQEDLISARLSALAFLRDASINRAELEREVGGRLPSTDPSDGVSSSNENEALLQEKHSNLEVLP